MYPGIADRMQKEITALAPSTMKIRSSLHQKENTLSGSVVPSWLPSPPSKLCGSPRPNTTKPVHPSSTESASKCFNPVNDRKSFSVHSSLPLSFHHVIKSILKKKK